MPLIEEAHKAARLLLDHAYVRIVARDEPDAVCAAALLGHAFKRESIDFHVSWLPRIGAPDAQALADERADALVLLGLSGDAAAEVPAARKIVLERGDAGKFSAEATLDARHAAQPGDTSLSSLAFLVTVAMSKRHRDLSVLAVAGSLAAGHHVGASRWAGDSEPRFGGMKGLDAEIASEAVELGHLQGAPALALESGPLTSALAQLDAPYISGLTGRARNARKLVTDLGLDGEASCAMLSPADAEKLGSFLALRLMQQGAPEGALDALVQPRWRATEGPLAGREAAALARQAEAGCAQGAGGLAFAALWPDAPAGADVASAVAAVREELIAALLKAEREARVEGRLRVIEAPRGALCEPLAHRYAASLAPQGSVVLAHHGATIALRAYGFGDGFSGAVRRAAQSLDAWCCADGGSARVSLALPDDGRFAKALQECLP